MSVRALRDEQLTKRLELPTLRQFATNLTLLSKTAIVEGLARRLEIEPETVPMALRGSQIVSLPIDALVAAILRGMFEGRSQHVIQELKERPNLILFLDGAHTLTGARSGLGASADAANILKSVLARGELRMIAATTLGEYREHIEEDEALARQFRCVTMVDVMSHATPVLVPLSCGRVSMAH